jgi:uncharacterized membrane protein
MARPRRDIASGNLNTTRIGAFSDGVFAIVITLLILNLRVPTLPEKSDVYDLVIKLLQLWPNLISYGMSFVVVGIYWVAHHIIFHFIERADRNLLWINLFFLMFVAFIPFPAALIGEYNQYQVAVVIYGATLILTGLLLALLWRYATKRRRLTAPDLDPYVIKYGNVRNLMAPIIYAVAIAVSFVSIKACLIIYIAVPVVYILPTGIERLIIGCDSAQMERIEEKIEGVETE